MRKFMVVSGFLGSGKTTVMMALTDHLCKTGTKSVMISNDLGRRGLADYCYSKAAGVPSEEISGECICFVTEDLVERLRRLYGGGAEIVMSDIPGFGVGALEHVYYKLRDLYPDECELAPFTVITEGAVLSKLMNGRGSDLSCILSSQLKEADLIVLNKTDLYQPEEKDSYLAFLREECPDTPVIAVSAVSGDGIPELAEYISGSKTQFREPDFGVTDEEFDTAFGMLSMYNCQYYAEVCCDDFDANDYLTALAEEIRVKLKEKNYDSPHLKLFAQGEDGDYCKVDLLSVDDEVILTHAMSERRVDLPVVINTTSAAKCADLTRIIDQAILDVSGRFSLSAVVFYKESFGLNDEGRI